MSIGVVCHNFKLDEAMNALYDRKTLCSLLYVMQLQEFWYLEMGLSEQYIVNV